MRRGQTPRPHVCSYNAVREEGSDPFAPNSDSLAAAVPLEGWGEEEQGARAAPEDHVTSYPGTGRKSALLGRVRTCQGACLVSSPTLAVRGLRLSRIRAPR